MKKLLLVPILLAGLFLVYPARAEETVCPSGSYSIDDGVCKQEPTGCPYGDSILLDSPKCAPPTGEQQTEDLQTIESGK